jgi:pyroglutamyl-peptidase
MTRMKRVLVVGFGPFLDVTSNPAERLARAVDGTGDRRVRIVGRVMPVSYSRAPALTLRWARELRADLVLGVGVARRRSEPAIERFGRHAADRKLADVDGVRLATLRDARSTRAAPSSRNCGFADELAAALRVAVSEDAGRYVCNAWLYRVLASRRDAAFLHVPPTGFPARRLVAALKRFVTRPRRTPSSSARARRRSR